MAVCAPWCLATSVNLADTFSTAIAEDAPFHHASRQTASNVTQTIVTDESNVAVEWKAPL
jgi:hypothetical protein